MTDHDRCPVCDKPRGYLMETHHHMPGLTERLRGVNGQADRAQALFEELAGLPGRGSRLS